MKSNRKLLIVTIILFAVIFSAGCVYYNTFHNARKTFNEAEDARKKSLSRGREVIQRNRYQVAIDKSLKVVENHPNTKYYDDALFVLGVSYYYMKQYGKSERRLRELIANFEDSKYIDDATLYLAKAKLERDEVKDATELFEDIFQGDYKEEFKTEAAMALGRYHFENKNYDASRQYFIAIRDSLGRDLEQRIAQKYIADGLFEQFDFNTALGGYLQLLGMDPNDDQKYHALFRATICSYRFQRIQDGMDYLTKLLEDEMYYDSLGVLKLKFAEGYELDDDLIQAENIYQEVVDESKNNLHVGEANYRLGLIYQFDYDDLTSAKEYYDAAAQVSRSSEAGQDAFQRSTDIGKLDEFTKKVALDTTATQNMIDDAAATQYELAELYWFKLNKPDSAIAEMYYLINTFPSAYDAPNAMIALAAMIREYEEDSVKADSILQEVLQRFPHSDYVPEALEALNLAGTSADTGYAGYYLSKAETFWVDDENIDSASVYYQTIVDSFPDSRYFLQARFALLWLTETYRSPGDSSLYFAYQEFVDSFPGNQWASLAQQRIKYQAKDRPAIIEEDVDTTLRDGLNDMLPGQESREADTGYADPLHALYVGPGGETIPLFSSGPVVVNEPFVYPTEAYFLEWEGDLYFQIKLDFSGEVLDHRMMSHSESVELDLRAEEAVETMEFDQLDVSQIVSDLELKEAPEGGGYWFVYKYRVVLPDHLR